MSKRLIYQSLLAALVGLALLLAGCSNDTGMALGTLELKLEGVDAAGVVVANGSNVVFEGMVQGSHSLELPIGTYQIDGQPSTQGLLDPSVQEVTVTKGRTTEVTLSYEQSGAAAQPVAGIKLEAVVDAYGEALPYRAEENRNKKVRLYATQTEEAICVRFKVTDAKGNPAAGARISVNIAEPYYQDDRISITRGCGVHTNNLTTASFRDDVVADDSGMGSFTLYAALGTSETADEYDVARVILGTNNENGDNVLHEFKLVPYNIAHLYFNGEPTDKRIGATFKRVNIFDPNDRHKGHDENGDDENGGMKNRNVFEVNVGLYQKQPELELKPGGIGFVCFFVEGEDIVVDGFDDKIKLERHKVLIDPPFPGTEEKDSCYLDYDGIITVQPDPKLRAEDMPVSAKVYAVLYTGLEFGKTDYYFPLKSFTVTKTWISTLITIDKKVDHHVLSWYGDNLDLIDGDDDEYIEHTLDPANAVPKDSVFTATFTLWAKNEGKENAFDVTLRDELPAELGVVEKSIKHGGSYNSVNHAVTWYIGTLKPGETAKRSFQVYVRQKPGYCVDREDLAASEFYSVGWTFGKYVRETICYDDPYRIINGNALHDVTVAYFPIKPAPEGHQIVTDFNGSVYKDQVVIYAVRPVFDIDKVLVNEWDLPLEVGMAGIFDISIENVDRAEYEYLMETYPDEFNGKKRDNPYARDTILSDIFLIGLDYTQASKLTVKDDDGVKADASYAPIFIGDPNVPPPTPYEPYLIDFGDKAIVWKTVPLMGGGDTGKATLKLNNNLPGKHFNLAALTAANMNQKIDLGDCGRDALAAYGLAERELGVVFGERFSFIADCAFVYVKPPKEPWLELSGVGNGQGLDDVVTFRETVVDGEHFYYIFYVENYGFGKAKHATLKVKLDNDNAVLLDAAVYTGPNGGPYALNPAIKAKVESKTAAKFGPYDHPDGVGAYFILKAKAQMVGNNAATATVNWDASRNDTQYPLLPYSVTERVSIKPKR